MASSQFADRSIFAAIQKKIDDDGAIRDELREVIDEINKNVREAQAILQVSHSSTKANVGNAIQSLGFEATQTKLQTSIKKLAAKASVEPFYKWNHMWTRTIQDAVAVILYHEWVCKETFMTPEQLAEYLEVPVGPQSRDHFHITTEDYLLALISLTEDLSRLARNAVTVGDYARPLAVSKFVKDIHAGFSMLNLKNDILRKRSDGIKYRLKDVEDVVYDLSLRNLLPRLSES